MSTGQDVALDPIRDALAAADDLQFRGGDCDDVLLELAAVAQHAREVARDTLEDDRTSSFYTDDEEAFFSLTQDAIRGLAEVARGQGCMEEFDPGGLPDTQLEVFLNGFQSGSPPLATGGLDNIAEWAQVNMSESMQQELERQAEMRTGRPDIRDGGGALEYANHLISEINAADGCGTLFDLADDVVYLVGEFADVARRGGVAFERGAGTAPAEVGNAWVLMYRHLFGNDCISEESRNALRDIDPVDKVRSSEGSASIEDEIRTAKFILAVEEGAEDGQRVTCSRLPGDAEMSDIRRNLLEAASKGNVEAAVMGTGKVPVDEGSQVLCAVLRDEIGG